MTRLASALVTVAALASCADVQWLTDEHVQRANDDRCLHAVDDDFNEYIDRLLAEIDALGVAIEEWDGDHAIAYANTLNVPRGFWERTDVSIAETLGHERAHYCQRRHDGSFDVHYARASTRFIVETQAYRQTMRIKASGPRSCSHMRRYANRTPIRLAGEPYYLAGIENLEVAIPIVWQEAEARCGPLESVL